MVAFSVLTPHLHLLKEGGGGLQLQRDCGFKTFQAQPCRQALSPMPMILLIADHELVFLVLIIYQPWPRGR